MQQFNGKRKVALKQNKDQNTVIVALKLLSLLNSFFLYYTFDFSQKQSKETTKNYVKFNLVLFYVIPKQRKTTKLLMQKFLKKWQFDFFDCKHFKEYYSL